MGEQLGGAVRNRSSKKRRHSARNAWRLVCICLSLGLIAGSVRAYFVHSLPPVQGDTIARYAQRARSSYNGFDVSNASIPVKEIFSGGPGRDGIPAILNPRFVSAQAQEYLSPTDRIVGVVHDGEARAYPLRILVWHEIVNDTVGGLPVAVTYCPLCGTSMVFDRRYDGEALTFGVSGLLYNSDVLMYDHQSESLWSQLKTESVSGLHAGTKLKWLASEEMTWAAWKERYPESEVLSRVTGFKRDYGRDPYGGYEKTEGTYFRVPKFRDELPNKARVIGVIAGSVAKAYPIDLLMRANGKPVEDVVGGRSITLKYDVESEWPKVIDTESGEAIPHVSAYWFAWQAFYPDTLLHAE